MCIGKIVFERKSPTSKWEKLSALKNYDEPQNDEHSYCNEHANIYDKFSIHECTIKWIHAG